jgi:hypothetical protein
MAKTWRRLPAKTRHRRVDEQANSRLMMALRFRQLTPHSKERNAPTDATVANQIVGDKLLNPV